MHKNLFCYALITTILLCSGQAYARDVIEHQVTIDDPTSHLIEVESTFPIVRNSRSELMMATWIPGSYLIREYSRHIQELQAFADGKPVQIEKVSKNRWKTPPVSGRSLTIRYRLYAHELTVRTNFVTEQIAIMNPIAMFLVPVDGLELPHRVEFSLPPGWQNNISALPKSGGKWQARNYQHLIDSPFLAGNTQVYSFELGQVPHHLVMAGDYAYWNTDRAAADIELLAARQKLFWGNWPLQQPYFVLNAVAEGRGGLEHDQSTLLLANRLTMRKREDYVDWLRLVSHEYFHIWNVRRLKPKVLMQPDYESEQFVPELWFSEGFTSYYDGLLLVRSGLITPDEYWKILAARFQRVLSGPGRLLLSLEDAAFDAWIRHYRPNENSPNSAPSYYDKGALVGFMLDMHIRRVTNGTKSLDDVMRRVYAQFSKTGFTTADVANVATQVAGESMQPFFNDYIRGTREINLAPILTELGLELVQRDEIKAGTPAPVSLGANVSVTNSVPTITHVPTGRAADAAGLSATDELVAINGIRTTAGNWSDVLNSFRVNETVQTTVSRRGRLMEIPVVLEQAFAKEWKLKANEDLTKSQRERLHSWLGGKWFVEEQSGPQSD